MAEWVEPTANDGENGTRCRNNQGGESRAARGDKGKKKSRRICVQGMEFKM